MLLENVPFPNYLQLDRTGFSQQLQLASALGLIHPDHIPPVKAVNSIRNKIAHQLDYAVTQNDELKIRSSLPKYHDQKDDNFEQSLTQILQFIAVLIDVERQERAFERVKRDQAMANARVVLAKFPQ